MSKYDFKMVADSALSRIDTVLAHWLPGGKRQGHEYVCLNPTRADQTVRSFSINMNTGVWSDFASGDKGGDLISLVAYLESSSQGDACKALASLLGLAHSTPSNDNLGTRAKPTAAQAKPQSTKTTADWQPVFPVPESTLASRPMSHPKLGKPSQIWEYRDSNGHFLMAVMRFDTGRDDNRSKDYRPQCYGKDSTGKTGWTWKQPTGQRPLYGLERLATTSTAIPVLLCEGEKAADNARLLFPDAVAMCWLSGSKATGKADFSPLAGREVWYWPDNDQAGKESVKPLATALKAVGVKSLSLLDIGLFDKFLPGIENGTALLQQGAGDGSGWPEKADAADAVAMGWTADHMAKLKEKGLLTDYNLNNPSKASKAADSAHSDTEKQHQGKYRSDENGLSYFDMKAEIYRPLGGRLDVLARSRNSEDRGWGLLVAFVDFDGNTKSWNIPATLFATEGGAEVVRGLLDRGYTLLNPTHRENKKRLLEYLGTYHTTERVRLVQKMGWHGNAFMLPDRVIGKPPEPLHFYSDSPPLCKMSQKGTVEQWRENVAAYCIGNSLPTFALCTAFAAPLLDVLGSETCGFHLVGDSSLGKSTLLKLAASVWGSPSDYPRTWRTTDNALEGTASAHSDCLLALDELGQIDPRIVGETIYTLGNGLGKARATETGGARGTSHRWRLVFLSSGEKALTDHMAEANKKPQAGQEIRLLTIPANPHTNSNDAQQKGIYESLGNFVGGAALSTHLMEQANQYHGTAIIQFLELLTSGKGREKLIQWIGTQRAGFMAQHLPANASGQAHRAADKFALVAAAGEYATMANLTAWPLGWATEAAGACFNAWLSYRGGAGSLEDHHALDHTRAMLNKYGESRFSRWEGDDARIDEHAPRTMERWGFRKTLEDSQLGTTENTFYLTREGFLEMCRGFDAKRVARLLHETGALETDKEPGRLTKKVRIPGAGKKPINCYVIQLAVLLAEDGGSAAANGTEAT